MRIYDTIAIDNSPRKLVKVLSVDNAEALKAQPQVLELPNLDQVAVRAKECGKQGRQRANCSLAL